MYLNLILYAVYTFTLFGCLMVGAFSWKRMQAPLRVFYLLIIAIVIGEFTALMVEIETGSNNQVYNVTDIVDAVLLFLYFGFLLKRLLTAVVLCIITVAFGIYNFYWLQHSALINNYFLLWSGLVTICLCLYTMIYFYLKEGVTRLTYFAHFWIATAVLFYWIVNLLGLQVFNLLVPSLIGYAILINLVQLASNILTYAAIGRIFYKLPKLIQ